MNKTTIVDHLQTFHNLKFKQLLFFLARLNKFWTGLLFMTKIDENTNIQHRIKINDTYKEQPS